MARAPLPLTPLPPNRLRSTLAALALAAAAVAAFGRALLAGQTWAAPEHLASAVPARGYLAASLRAGRLPHWWAEAGAGAPFLADPGYVALYPPAWLAALFPAPVGADVVVALHGTWLAFGVFLWARRLGAGAWASAFAGAVALCAGYTASAAAHGPALFAAAWLPWVGWAADRLATSSGRGRTRAAVVLVIVVALLLLAGDPAGAVIGVALVMSVAAVRGNARGVSIVVAALSVLGAAALAGAQLVPALALAAEGPGGVARAGGAAVSPWHVLEWFWPGALGDPTEPARDAGRFFGGGRAGVHWGYVGAPVLALAAASGHRALVALSVGFAALAVVAAVPLSDAVSAALPFGAVGGDPARYLAGALCLWWPLSGVGLQRWLVDDPPPGASRWSAGVAIALAAAAVASWQLAGPAFAGLAPVDELDVDATAAVATRGIVLAAGVTALFAAAVALRRRRATRVAAAVVGFGIVFHLAAEAHRFSALVDQTAVAVEPAGPARDEAIDTRPRACVTSRWRRLADEAAVLAARRGASADEPTTVWLVGGTRAADDDDASEPRADDDASDNEATTEAAPEATPCRREVLSPERVRLHCDHPSAGFAVLRDAWAPGWTAEVDGVAAEVERADGRVRAVAVPAGVRVVEFRYRTPGLTEGVLVTLGAAGLLLVILGVAAWPGPRRRTARLKQRVVRDEYIRDPVFVSLDEVGRRR